MTDNDSGHKALLNAYSTHARRRSRGAFAAPLLTGVTAVRFVDNNTFRFYGIKGGQIYRVTLGL